MFTGLIGEVGRIQQIQNDTGTRRLIVAAEKAPRELKKGDSVAVSGVCLTAVEVHPGSFAADLAVETLARTSFSRIQKGALVNLELPVKSGARMDGHMVQGHVDGTGKIVSLKKIKNKEDYWLRVSVPEELTRYIVDKGSLAIEGISLTVARVNGTEISLAIIPHTYKATNLHSLKLGEAVNLEVDVLAKYAEKLVQSGSQKSSITLQRLVDEGF
jgi:riboflavin synthase